MQIRYSCYFGSSGYAVSAFDYLRSMQTVKPDCDIKTSTLNEFRKQSGISQEHYEWFNQLKKTPLKTDYISVQHCIPRIYAKNKAKKNIGISVYETIDPPKPWIQKMNEMDHIITASHFNEGVFKSGGVTAPISVVPHCFDSTLFNDKTMARGRYNLFTFMYISTWKQRKNFSSLIRAFYNEFSESDNVCLLLKTDKKEDLKKTILTIKNDGFKTKKTSPIYTEEEKLTFEEIPRFIKKADVYISPSLGEGFGISNLHAMALKIPLITTKYSGCLEYAKPEYCTYIEPNGYKQFNQMDGYSQFHNKIWPDIRVSEIQNKMRFVFSSYPTAQKKANNAYNYVHQHFNYNIIGRRFLSAIGEKE